MKRSPFICWFLICTGLVWAQDAPQVDPFSTAEEALLDRQYEEAIALLTPLADQPGDRQDYALFLLGNAYFYQGEYEHARAAFQLLRERFPQSPYRHKALFRQADCYLKQGDFVRAGEIYAPEMLHLVSAERRQEIAAEYLRYADQYFQPEDEEEKPNYKKAQSLYTKALDLGLTPEKEEEVRFRIARCQFERRKYGEAVQSLREQLDKFPEGARREEATVLLGRCYLQMGNERAARRVFRDFLQDYPDSPQRAEVSYALAQTYHVPQPRTERELELGVKALRDFVQQFPQHEKATQADYEIGLSFYHRNRPAEAAEEFARFLRAHRQKEAPQLPEAQNLLGLCYLRQEKYSEALAAWQEFLRTYPTHRLWNTVQRQVIDTEYLIGEVAYQDKRYAEAQQIWQAFQAKYPLDVRNPDIMFRLGLMEYEQENYQTALAQWEKLTSKYPDSDAAMQGWFMSGETYETKLGDLKAARRAYEKVTKGPWKEEAQRRLRAMKQPALTVYTERTFTTADAPVLKLLTRNLARVDLRGYRIDLEDYFRKLHTIQGVAELDLALIEPDRRWSLDIPNYEDYKQLETEVPLPFKEPGVYAVAVSATPGPERGTRGKGRASRPGRAGGSSTTLESTVVVMITDLGLICKATRRDLLVFTENLRTQEPFGGVQVLVSDGNTIFATGQTDENGVWHAELPELRPASQVKVLALSGTHFASTENDLQGVQFAPGLAPKAFLYTDRPLYRPGQTVHLRGIVRKVEHGRYTFTPGEEFTQTVLAPDGTVIHTARVKLNAFGTYSDQFPLPPEAPVGTYRIRLVQRKPVRLSFEGAFEVATYELPKIQLTIEVPRNTYLRGEDIEGKIVAQYYYGEPVAQREVRFGWDEEPGEVKTTDAQGEIAFTLPTRQFEEEQVVRLWARMEEENVAAARLVHIAVVGLRAQVSTFRRVYLVNEPFDLTVKLTDLGGDPVGKEVSVNLIKWERTERGEVKERSVATYPLTTDPQTGKGVTQVSVPEAGNYLFRLQTADAHGNPVSAETRVRIVGEDDEVKLRFLTDTDTFQVGAEAQLTLVSRSGARLALLTYEGERIYGYQIVRLQPGPNKITLRMTPELAPNFNLVAAAMAPPPAHPAPEEPTTWQFHTATKALQVELGLRVTVAPEKSTYRPGERVRLRVQTTDQNGRPLPAELSLAAVDEALFAVHPDPTPDLGSFFYQRELAKRAVVTQTSCTFHYSAEAQRRVLLVKEQERRIPLAMRVPLLGAVPVMGELFARRGFGGFGGWAADMVARFQGPRGPAGPPGPQAGAMPGVPPPSPPVAEEVAVEEKALLARRPRPTAPAPIPAVRAFFPETAFWNAHLVTDEKGQARVEFELPDTITKWVLVARGVTVETLAGEERASLVTRQPFLVELKLPTVFQQGDTVFVTAELRNNTEEELRATATLSVGPAALPSPPGRASGAGVAGGGPTTISIAPHSTQELAFRVEVPAGRELPLSLEVTTDRGLADAVRHSVPIRPWGQEHFDAEGGTAADDRLVWLELPPAEYQWKDLHITVGPSLERALLDAVLLPPVIIRPWARVEVNLQFAPCVSNLPARAQAVLAAMAYLRQLNRTEVPEYRRLAQELEALVARLAATQNQDGGWSWAQRGKQSDPFVSAAAVAVWAQARRLGLPVPAEALGKALAYLQNAFQRAAETDYPLKVAILQAQAAAGRVDFGPLNRLYRLRAGLDTRSLAVLMSLLADLERVPMARDLEPLLRERIKHLDGQAHCEAAKTPLRWGGDAVETTALALLALSKIHAGASVRPPVLNKLAEWLWAQRIGNTWPTPTATAAAVTALAYYTALVPPAAEQYTLTVRVNDREVRRLKITGDTRTQTIAVPPELLPEARVKVAFDLEGRGQYAYNCQLVGFTEEIIPRSEEFYLRRKVLQPPRLFEGRPVPRGFSVVDASEGVKTWENLATQTPAGKQVVVRLDWHTQRDFRPGAYVVLWEPLPAGTRVLEETIRGSFERYVLGAAEITFFYRTHNRPWERGWAQFDLYGAFPGAYRVLPPRVWAAYQPQHYGLAPAGRLDVLRRDQPTTDQYRLTPDELYHLGTKHFERQDYAVAEGHLSTLFDQWKLRERPFKETARMLFHLALHRGDAARTVRFFELLRERYPTHVVPLSEIVKVAQAYRQLGEHEREVQVYRVTAAASFGQESRVAGVLEEEGEIAAAVEFMHHLALTYPDVPSTENALYTLGQFIYDRAAKLASQTRTSSRTWFDRALQQLRQFLVFYPVSPVADEASFTLANALLEQQRLAEAIAWSRRAQERYPQSVFRDDFEYIEAYAHFLNEEFEAALELCQRLAKGTYPRREGGQAPSDYRWLALYIAAQVFHSRNSPSEAVEYYRQVAHKFPDAQEALDYFQHTELRVPEVTVAQGEEPVRLKITTRNVPTAQVTVYRVDLLKFYQQHRSLQDLAKMNLAGVRPTLAREVTLSPERYVPQETTVELPLPETGAYFVMVKSGGLTATGILLRTNLALEVQEDPDSGRVRVNVINRAENKYEPRTEVWVVGSANEQFLKGQTDLRGVFVADDIRGTTTVVAWKAGQYAFYRGTKVLQPPAVRERARAERRRVPARKRAKFHEEALRGLRAGQAAIQQQRSRELEEQLKGGGFEAGGVQVQQAF